MQESMLQLLISMTKRREIYVQDQHSICYKGVVNAIQAEDGSGTSFNVTISGKDGNNVIYLKRPVGSGLCADDPIRSESIAWLSGI